MGETFDRATATAPTSPPRASGSGALAELMPDEPEAHHFLERRLAHLGS